MSRPDADDRPDAEDPFGHLTNARLTDDWVAIYWWVTRKGRPTLAEAHVVPASKADWWTLFLREIRMERQTDIGGHVTALPRGGLPVRTLRAVRPQAALQAELEDPRALLAMTLGWWGAWRELAERELARVADRGQEREPRLHRLARVARLYVALVAEGRPRVNEEIGHVLGREPSHVRDDIYAARREGLLTAGAGRGRSSGELTDKGRAIVAQLDQEVPE